MLKYNINKGQSINHVAHSDVVKTNYKQHQDETFDAPVNLEEGYKQIVYPVRKDFINDFKDECIAYPQDIKFNYLYSPFENSKVEFSNFINTPHKLEVYSKVTIVSPLDQSVDFTLDTCGKVMIWINGNLQVEYAPFTRNINSSTSISLDLQAGDNEVIIYALEIAERDVFYYYQLTLNSDINLEYYVDTNIDQEKYDQVVDYIDSIFFEQDANKSDIIKYNTHLDSIDHQLYFSYSEGFDIYRDTCGSSDWKLVDQSTKSIDLSGDSDFMSYVTIQAIIDGIVVSKRFFISKITTTNVDLETIEERKKFAAEYIAKHGQVNVNKSLVLLSLNNEYNQEVENGLLTVLEIVESKGDCADFYIVPLMIILKKYSHLLPTQMHERLKQSILDFRYWIDEPGSDVMWWFSENHALLFHIAQYIAGDLYPNEVFTVSGNTGAKHSKIGKDRIVEWFEIFNKYGLAEWNSTTYIPIDIIGFLSLFELAPDAEIKQVASDAMDLTLKIIALNFNGDMMASSYGRCYEKELKAMEFGELTFITWMLWGKGYINTTSRSTALMALTDYQPPMLTQHFTYDGLEAKTIEYKQGINGVYSYLFKNSDYAVGSVVNYKAGSRGHQQHLFNISLKSDNTQLWINNPGELVPSGENRPSYWAGNQIMPRIEQVQNMTYLDYDLAKASIKMVHMYIPNWKIDQIIIKDNYYIIVKDDVYVGVSTNVNPKLTKFGPNTNKEIAMYGEDIKLAVLVERASNYKDLEEFSALIAAIDVSNNELQFGDNLLSIEESLVKLNGKEVKREADYLK